MLRKNLSRELRERVQLAWAVLRARGANLVHHVRHEIDLADNYVEQQGAFK